MQLLTWYLILVNAASCLLMLIDKQKAIHRSWRIPERVLLGLAAIGGSAGALIGMHAFHHKTKHRKFTVGIRLLLLTHFVLFYLLIK